MLNFGQLIGKTHPREAAGHRRGWEGGETPAPTTSGLAAGTQVATAQGWRNIEAVQVGDKVLTFDDGMQKVVSIQTAWVLPEQRQLATTQLPLHVPKGALGNKSDLTLMPEQAVMIESDLGEVMFGDPFTLIPALALEGFKGITRQRPSRPLQVVSLQFDNDQVVFASVGALFYCPSNEAQSVAGIFEESYMPGYEVLTLSKAREFVDTMEDEDAQDAAWLAAERAFNNVHVVA